MCSPSRAFNLGTELVSQLIVVPPCCWVDPELRYQWWCVAGLLVWINLRYTRVNIKFAHKAFLSSELRWSYFNSEQSALLLLIQPCFLPTPWGRWPPLAPRFPCPQVPALLWDSQGLRKAQFTTFPQWWPPNDSLPLLFSSNGVSVPRVVVKPRFGNMPRWFLLHFENAKEEDEKEGDPHNPLMPTSPQPQPLQPHQPWQLNTALFLIQRSPFHPEPRDLLHDGKSFPWAEQL